MAEEEAAAAPEEETEQPNAEEQAAPEVTSSAITLMKNAHRLMLDGAFVRRRRQHQLRKSQ